jgi:hypothetical protein
VSVNPLRGFGVSSCMAADFDGNTPMRILSNASRYLFKTDQ